MDLAHPKIFGVAPPVVVADVMKCTSRSAIGRFYRRQNQPDTGSYRDFITHVYGYRRYHLYRPRSAIDRLVALRYRR